MSDHSRGLATILEQLVPPLLKVLSADVANLGISRSLTEQSKRALGDAPRFDGVNANRYLGLHEPLDVAGQTIPSRVEEVARLILLSAGKGLL